MKRGTIFQGKNQQLPLGRRGLNWLRGNFFEEKAIKLPQRATLPNQQRNFPKDQGIVLKEKETKW
jgi:hypothetical protein